MGSPEENFDLDPFFMVMLGENFLLFKSDAYVAARTKTFCEFALLKRDDFKAVLLEALRRASKQESSLLIPYIEVLLWFLIKGKPASEEKAEELYRAREMAAEMLRSVRSTDKIFSSIIDLAEDGQILLTRGVFDAPAMAEYQEALSFSQGLRSQAK